MIIDAKDSHITNEYTKMKKEVIIYESGSPILKVETGTTLKVLKLLYESQYSKEHVEILGVRPRATEEEIPCIVTSNESKLNELTYDILVSDGQEKRISDNGDERITIFRCIDCSRKSWKAKQFTSVGMNTELSETPVLKSGEITKDSQITSNQGENPKNKKDLLNPIPLSFNGTVGSIKSEEEHFTTFNSDQNEVHYVTGHQLASPTYEKDVFNKHSKFRHGSRDPLYYEHVPPPPPHVWPESHVRYPHHYMTAHDHSPPVKRQGSPPRTRALLSPRHIKLHDSYSMQYHRLREKHMLMLHAPQQEAHRHGRLTRLSPVPYEQQRMHEEHRLEKQHSKNDEIPIPHLLECRRDNETHMRTSQPAEDPPVFVLPNDYDIVNGGDSCIASLQDRRLIKSPGASEREREMLQKIHDIKEIKEETIYCNDDSQKTTKQKQAQEKKTPSGQKLFCKICNSVFPTKSLLYKHLRGHSSDEKPFKCSECGQGFTLSSNLRQHRIIHRGYKPFQCEFCGKKFMRSNVYKQHRRIHTGEEMHKCTLCPSEFLQKYALQKHMKKSHNIDTTEN